MRPVIYSACMARVYAAVIILTLFVHSVSADQCTNIFEIPWFSKINKSEIELDLKESEIIGKFDLMFFLMSQNIYPSLSSNRYIVRLGGDFAAVFKPETSLYHSYGEVAAYRLSEFLGLNLVPPTVIRNINGYRGILQVFIEPNSENPFHFESKYSGLTEKKKSEIELFAYLIGHSQINKHNLIFDSLGEPALIDNGDLSEVSLMNPVGLKFARKYFSKDFIFGIKTLNSEVLKKLLPEYFKDNEIQAILFRRDLILESASRGELI